MRCEFNSLFNLIRRNIFTACKLFKSVKMLVKCDRPICINFEVEWKLKKKSYFLPNVVQTLITVMTSLITK